LLVLTSDACGVHTSVMDQVQEPGNTHLGYLVNRTLALISRHWKRYFLLIGLPLFTALLYLALLLVVVLLMQYALVPTGMGGIGIVAIVLISLVFIPAMLLTHSWSSLALTHSVAFSAGGRESLSETKGSVLSWWWISIISSLVIFGGSMLIVPAIILAFRLALAEQALVVERVKGMRALFASRTIVAGHYLSLLFLAVVASIPSFLLSMINQALESIESPNVIGLVLAALSLPLYIWAGVWTTVLLTLFYLNVKAKKGEVATQPSKGFKVSIVLWSILGVMVLIAMLTIVGTFYTKYRHFKETTKQVEQQDLQEEAVFLDYGRELEFDYDVEYESESY
jgi:hypothetical protein